MPEENAFDVFAKPPAEVTEFEPKKSWEDLVSAYSTVQEVGDGCQWALGDIANEVERCFGKSRDTFGNSPLDKFASEIGERKKTVEQYAWVSRAYPTRDERKSGLSWSHYRAAAKTAKNKEQGIWITRAVEGNWTVEQLMDQIKNVEDHASVENGRPCSYCGQILPEEGSYHIRQDGQKIASLCSAKCGAGWFFDRAKGSVEEKIAA